MKRTVFAIGLLLGGCGADGPAPDDSSAATNEALERAPDARPFYAFEVRGHVFEFVQPGGAGLVLVEKSPIGAASLLDGVDVRRPSVSDMYRHLKPGTEVPRELLEFEARVELVSLPGEALPGPDISAPEGSPQRASLPAPGQHTTHEGGSAHFQSSHCPTQPDPATGFSFYEEHSPKSTRLFCWANGYTGTWTESSSAKVLTHDVAAVFRSVRYEMKVQGWSAGWDVLQGQQTRFNGWNGKFWDCWCVPICACGDQDYNVKSMSGKVFDGTQGPSTWRFGGGFWK
ncbi:MAG TPA: hypothetical protein VI072_21415 [Polyangiaceae bacterium]